MTLRVGSGFRDAGLPVVVGIDGFEPSLRALRWATRQALWMEAPLVVVTAWTFPDSPAPLGIVVDVPYQDQLIKEAHDELNRIVAAEIPLRQRGHIETKVIRGLAVPVLLAQAAAAALLVVGRQEEGVIERVLVGSVSEHCVRDALCPVVVVR
jgi:nucleotide-binding universal stress UspA family protein